GGRYDGLVEQLGGRPTPAVGFAMGVERLIALLEESENKPSLKQLDAYLVLMGEAAQKQGLILAEKLRGQCPDLRLLVNCGAGSFKSQFKKADRSGARYALILGDDELKQDIIGVKPLRGEGEQRQIALSDLAGFFSQRHLP
ncbi:MAG: His/Gly/Thr/Pro-type tRNA ligase C-terminal domain-containing protein, partial [Sedimenticolaceae bacterium]